MRRPGWLVAAIAMTAVTACSPSENTADVDGTPEADPAIAAPVALGETPDSLSDRAEIVTVETQTGVAGAYTDDCLITGTSIAGISTPRTLGAFAGAFPAGARLVFEPRHMVDFGSLCFIAGGRERVCTLFYEAEVPEWSPEAEALGLYTRDPECRTEEGIGPGSAVTAAAEVFGVPEFRFNYDNEGREYVAFADAPPELGFRVASDQAGAIAGGADAQKTFWPNGDFGGDYRAGAEDFVTADALPGAEIVEVSIY